MERNRGGGCVMVSVLASSAIDRLFETIQLVFVASPLRTQHSGERANTGCIGIRIICPSGATCPSADCYFSELALKKKNKRVGLVESGPHHHFIEN